MKYALRYSTICALLLVTGQLHAQDTAIGSRIERRPTVGLGTSGSWALGMAHHTIGCAVTQHKDAARRYLEALTEQDVKQARRAMFGTELSCAEYPGMGAATDVRIMPPQDIERGMIAEALLSKDQNTGQALPLTIKQQRYARPWFVETGRNIAVDEMATCVAETDPQGIVAVLHTTPDSGGELKAIQNLQTLGPCLAAGTRLEANRQSLRAALAEALYHRVNDPVAAQDAQGTK